MAPETRSHGVPPPSRVYNSSPALQQVQFPARRKKIRRYGNSDRSSLKQQTLTQIDFVSSFDEDDVVALSDSDDDIKGGDEDEDDKENVNPKIQEDIESTQDEDNNDDDDDEPVSRRRKRATSTKESRKRRRTMGDDTSKAAESRKDDKSRRKTLGDVPTSSNYHTQTLTQFLGHQTSFIADSDDDLELHKDEGEEGFLSWLGEPEPEPGSPSAGRGRRDFSSPAVKQRHEAAAAASRGDMSREDSVIPQTPAKRTSTIRFEIPSGGLRSPSERMMDRYGAPDKQDSPLKNHSSPMKPPPLEFTGEASRASRDVTKPPSLVIQDSYATESWTTPSKSHMRGLSQQESPTPLRMCSGTPSKLNPFGNEGTPTRKAGKRKTPSPKKVTLGGVYEIPDSDEDEDGFEEDEDEDGAEIGVESENVEETRYGAGVETQLVMSEMASTDGKESCQDDTLPCSTPSKQTQPKASSPPAPSTTTESHKPSTPKAPRTKPLRKPLHHPSNHTQQSQPWESQRVPISILQSLPTPSARSDILLPMSTTSLEALISGHTIHITTPFKIPPQVIRFWLFEKNLLRYMATVEQAGEQISPPNTSSSQGEWQFHAGQVYELNNPVCEEDMREEGWVDGLITRYTYLPPAVIGQLLWNLRHAIFGDVDHQQQQQHILSSSPMKPSSQPDQHKDDNKQQQPPSSPPPGSMTVSQQITAQIHSDIASSTQFPTSDNIPSTPDFNPSSATTHPTAKKQQQIRPSQATTASQLSTPEKRTQLLTTSIPPPPPLFNPSENSIQFIEGGSLGSLPFPSSMTSASQLLTKSQMLPDSLIRDYDAPPEPPEIWDSDEEDASL